MDGGLKINDREFNDLRKITYNHIGVNLTETKKALVVSRLGKRLKQLNMQSFSEYCRYLEKNNREIDVLANLITTNVSKFFREIHHFEFLKNHILPQVVREAEAGERPRKVKVWSAGCSTGEEPYSIAIVIDDFLNHLKGWDFRILASDINSRVLSEAATGVYSADKVKGTPHNILGRYFAVGTGANRGLFKIKDSLRKKIIFRNINLIKQDEYPRIKDLDFIFCRNVFIYFDRENQNKILESFASRVRAGGYLFLGHSETIAIDSPAARHWQLVHHTVYRRRKPEDAEQKHG